MDCEWDSGKAASNLRKHGVDFADAAVSLEDPLARTIADPDASGEQRFVTIGADPTGRILITIAYKTAWAYPDNFSRRAGRAERRAYEEDQ